MALHGCLRCTKFVVFSLNFIVWLTGMGILGLAIYMRMDPKMNHYIKAAYADDINTYHIICYILIGCGGAMTFVGFLGCCGAFQESKCMLGTFFAFLFLIFAAEVAGGVWAFVHRHQIEDTVTETFTKLVKEDYGKGSIRDESIDYVQRTLQCCGGTKAKEWTESEWSTDPKHRFHRLNQVPDSCCKTGRVRKTAVEGMCGVGGFWSKDSGSHSAVWDTGCGKKLIDEFQQHLLLIVGVGLGIAGIEFLSLCFSMVLCCGMMQQSHGGYKV